MEPAFVEKGPMILVGFSFFGDPFKASSGWTEENEIGRLWQRFITYLMDHRDRIKHIAGGKVSYELHVTHEETASTGDFEVFVGVEVERLEDVPVELLVKILPATKYAVFTLEGTQITSDWSKMISEWLPQAGYESAGHYGIQRYDRRFKGVENIEESELDVYVPVRRRSDVPRG